jgi:hypothetical protein
MFVSHFQPSKAIEPTRVEPLTRAEVTDGSKHSSLLGFGMNYYFKKFYITGPHWYHCGCNYKYKHINVCREIGWLLSFVYSFGWVAHQCC